MGRGQGPLWFTMGSSSRGPLYPPKLSSCGGIHRHCTGIAP